jgi:hypothetical protein
MVFKVDFEHIHQFYPNFDRVKTDPEIVLYCEACNIEEILIEETKDSKTETPDKEVYQIPVTDYKEVILETIREQQEIIEDDLGDEDNTDIEASKDEVITRVIAKELNVLQHLMVDDIPTEDKLINEPIEQGIDTSKVGDKLSHSHQSLIIKDIPTEDKFTSEPNKVIERG